MPDPAVTPKEDIYTVTYSLRDTETGANPTWHAFITLSKLDKETGLMKVDAAWGFLGAGSKIENFLDRIKITEDFDLELDFLGNHAFMRQEDLHLLDLGKGLHGKLFELTPEKYEELQNKCKQVYSNQAKAIQEIAASEQLSEAKTFHLYPYEKHSHLIYKKEFEKAQKAGVPPRLFYFGVKFSPTMWGPSVHKTVNCKVLAIGLLTDILKKEEIAPLVSQGAHSVCPLCSGDVGFFTCFSRGPMRVYNKTPKEAIFYHKHGDPGVTTYMIPPQQIVAKQSTRAALQMPKDLHPEAVKIFAKLQKIEKLFCNTKFVNEHAPLRKKLMEKISKHYAALGRITPNKNTETSRMKGLIDDANRFIKNEFESFLSCLTDVGKEELCKIIEKSDKHVDLLRAKL